VQPQQQCQLNFRDNVSAAGICSSSFELQRQASDSVASQLFSSLFSRSGAAADVPSAAIQRHTFIRSLENFNNTRRL
jgi:hypothetical protein